MHRESDLERERYEARLKYQRDERAQREYGIEEACKEARKEGMVKGRKEELVERIQLCERILNQALTPSETLLAMSLEQMSELAKQLTAQVTAGK
jgi:hypothetical protein